MYQFQFDLGYKVVKMFIKKAFLTIYNLVVFNYNKLSNTGYLFSINEIEAKLLSFVIIGVW